MQWCCVEGVTSECSGAVWRVSQVSAVVLCGGCHKWVLCGGVTSECSGAVWRVSQVSAVVLCGGCHK